jgi:HEAT repeat protein
MMTHHGLRLITSFCMSFLFCLLLLAHVPVSLGQQLKVVEVSALVNDLKDDAHRVRYAALKALGSIGRDKLKVAELARELKDKDPQVRAVAFGRIAAMSNNAQAAAPTLIELLKDADKRTRRVAVYVLGETHAKVPIPILIALLKDEDRDTRADIMLQLSFIGPEARAAVPALIEILSGNDNYLRGHAASALGGIGADAKPAAPILFNMLRDPDAHMRSSAAYALRKVELDASTVSAVINARATKTSWSASMPSRCSKS